MQERNKMVMMDTCFFIRMLNSEDPLHKNALEYYKSFLNHEYALRVSTIAVGEFCTKGKIESLPWKNVMPVPFNIKHAERAGAFMSLVYEEKKKRGASFGNRLIIPNDTKMFAQAEVESVQYYLTSDSESAKIYEILRRNGYVGFEFIDIHVQLSTRLGELPFDE